MSMSSKKDIIKIISLPVLFASLCCLSPLILVMLGLSSVAFASSLADTLYVQYKWLFRGVGLILLIISFILYLRKSRGICTLDQAMRHKNQIINLFLITLIAAISGYVIWLYVIVEYAGKWLKIWN